MVRKDARAMEVTTDASAETVFVMAIKIMGEDWREICRKIRKLCTDNNLLDTSVEIADARGLKPVRSFPVDTSEQIYRSWPDIKKNQYFGYWDLVLGWQWSFCSAELEQRQKRTLQRS